MILNGYIYSNYRLSLSSTNTTTFKRSEVFVVKFAFTAFNTYLKGSYASFSLNLANPAFRKHSRGCGFNATFEFQNYNIS